MPPMPPLPTATCPKKRPWWQSTRPTPLTRGKCISRLGAGHEFRSSDRLLRPLLSSKSSSALSPLFSSSKFPPETPRRPLLLTEFPCISHRTSPPLRRNPPQLLVAPFLAAGSSYLHSVIAARADETPLPLATVPTAVEKAAANDVVSRIYDATVIGEPLAVGKDKKRVWEKLMNARIVYLGEAEQVPDREDKDLELEIVKNLKSRCLEQAQHEVYN